MTPKRRDAIKWALFFVLLSSILLALCLGRYPVRFSVVLQDIGQWIRGSATFEEMSPDLKVVFLRIPRVIMSLLAGAALAASGTVYQGLFRNPLVSPDILGISSGACLGAALAIISPIRSPFLVQILAFVFGVGAVFLSYQLASMSKGHTVIMLVMSGIVVSSFLGSVLAFIKYVADPYHHLPTIIFWIMGGLHNVGWNDLSFSVPLVGAGLMVLHLLRRNLNVISLGDEEAALLGIDVKKMRIVLILCSTMVVAACIAVTGIIGWVGLIVPHISRILVGANHTKSFPCSIWIGAWFVLLIDTLARTVTTQEIPIGIITSLIGAPFFAYLLLFKQEKGWGRW